MSKDKAREFWIDDDGMALNNVPLHSEYIHVIEYSAYAALEARLAECVAAIQYVMANNDKIKGWDKLHDAFYGAKK